MSSGGREAAKAASSEGVEITRQVADGVWARASEWRRDPGLLLFAPDIWKRLALIAAVLFLVVVELLNTAIEKLADHVTPALHPGIGRIKDMGSAAVGVALLLAAAIWLVAIGERLAIL